MPRFLLSLFLCCIGLVAFAQPAEAKVEVSFHSFNGSVLFGRYPHTFVVFEGTLEDTGTPVVIHVNSGPVPTSRTGPEPLRALMAAYPRLTLVLAHMGAPHYEEFMAVAEKYDRVHLDTTMAFTDFWEQMAPFPPDLLPRLRDLQHKVVLGSDFPNIPYPYAHQLEALARLGLGDDWLRDICWHNGVRLFQTPPDTPTHGTKGSE